MEVQVFKFNMDLKYLKSAKAKLYELIEADPKIAKDFYGAIKTMSHSKIHSTVRSVSKTMLGCSLVVALASILVDEIRGDYALATALASATASYAGTQGAKACTQQAIEKVVAVAESVHKRLDTCDREETLHFDDDIYYSLTEMVVAELVFNKDFSNKVCQVVKANKRKNKNSDNTMEM